MDKREFEKVKAEHAKEVSEIQEGIRADRQRLSKDKESRASR